MTRALKRVRIGPNTNLLRIIEDVHADKAPRLIEREGEPLAVVIDPEEYGEASAMPKSKRHKSKLLSLAGAWSDLDADQVIEELYKARHETPPSAPVQE